MQDTAFVKKLPAILNFKDFTPTCMAFVGEIRPDIFVLSMSRWLLSLEKVGFLGLFYVSNTGQADITQAYTFSESGCALLLHCFRWSAGAYGNDGKNLCTEAP